MLNEEQSNAVDNMVAFLQAGESHFFALTGSAGTGKTYCIRELRERIKGRFIYTAPTNKATKVLRDTLTTPEYRPECKTIYSLLGLRLEANGEIKELSKPEEEIDLSLYTAIIVDEGSMVNSTLVKYIQEAALEQDLKFIFMLDLAQLPPVGEQQTKVCEIADETAELTKVMRYDNQILTLATNLRKQVYHPAPSFKPITDNLNGEGIWSLSGREFRERILEAAGNGRFSDGKDAKAIAWTNATTITMNNLIRARLFDDSAMTTWLPTDRVILMEPANDLEGEKVASTDDEGVVLRADIDYHPHYPEFKIWRLTVTLDDNRTIALRTLHEDSQRLAEARIQELLAAAKLDRRKWKQFWDFKEAFHKARHGYAITAHRSQGSTYNAVFVDWRDILSNRTRSEAFRCLYVACTRPKHELYLGG